MAKRSGPPAERLTRRTLQTVCEENGVTLLSNINRLKRNAGWFYTGLDYRIGTDNHRFENC
jgi:hypothetical protein